MRLENAFDGGEIVVRRVERERGDGLRHARGGRDAEGGQPRARFGKKAVAVAVIAALELYDQVAPGGRARQAHGAHGRLGSRADEAHALARRQAAANHRREFDLELGGHSVAGAARGLLRQRGDDFGMRVAQDQRAPGADVIEVGVAVGVPKTAARGAIDHDRRSADGAESAHRAIDAAHENFAGAVEDLLRTGPLAFRGGVHRAARFRH